MWRILGNSSFSQTGLRKRYQEAKQLLLWESVGWTREDVKQLAKKDLQPSDFRIGSQAFNFLWQAAYGNKEPQKLLSIVLDMAAMPEELSGDLQENQELVHRFSDDLAPDNTFWHEFSLLVQEIFPKNTLSAKTNFAKRIHQFRYVISSQQAQWIRDHLRNEKMTDAQALARFLRKKKRKVWYHPTYDYTLYDSARLHNKVAFKDGQTIYPDDSYRLNFKVLLNFHTEFILDNEGHFLNEIDAEHITQNGIINGASFNYANSGNQRHWELDVNPTKSHDPLFRDAVIATKDLRFTAPKYILKKIEAASEEDWQKSYFNKKGLYASGCKSNFKAVKHLIRQFKKELFKLKWTKN